MMTLQKTLVATAAALAFSVGAPAFAAADTVPASPSSSVPSQAQAPGHWHSHDRWQGKRGHHRPMMRDPFFMALHKTSLTPDQRKAIHADFKSTMAPQRASMKTLWQARKDAATAIPGSPDYTAAYQRYEKASAEAADARVKAEAALHAAIYKQLTPDQQKAFSTALAQAAQQPARTHGPHRPHAKAS